MKEGKNGKSSGGKKKDKGKGVSKLSPGDIEVVQNDAVSTTSSVSRFSYLYVPNNVNNDCIKRNPKQL